MKKQIITIITATTLALSMTACGNEEITSSVQAVSETTTAKVAENTVAKAEVKTEEPETPEIAETEESGTLYTLDRTVMYKTADDTQKVYSYLPAGCELAVLAKTENGYTKVRYGLKQGYLKNELLTAEAPEIPEPEEVVQGQNVSPSETKVDGQADTKTAATATTAAPATSAAQAATAAPAAQTAAPTPAAPSAAEIAAQQAVEAQAQAIAAQQAAEAEAAAAQAAAVAQPAPAPTPGTVIDGIDYSQGYAPSGEPSLIWTQEMIDASNADPTRVSAGNHTVEEMNLGNISDVVEF